MPVKVLLLNFPKDEALSAPSDVKIESRSWQNLSTLHDYHVILLDCQEFAAEKWMPPIRNQDEWSRTDNLIKNLPKRVEEQVRTGGTVFAFAGQRVEHLVNFPDYPIGRFIITYDWLPVDLNVVNEGGDTFELLWADLGLYTPLFRDIREGDLSWECYFTDLPKGTKVLAKNRAGYCISAEVPLGQGRIVLLPKFQDRTKVIITIIREVIPKMYIEEEPTYLPDWLSTFSSPLEEQVRRTVKEIESAKRLLYTKDKPLKKSVAFAFSKMGFEVAELPDGAFPDLELKIGLQKVKVGIRGHNEGLSDKKDVLQLLGYLEESGVQDKGVFVTNHELTKEPSKRSREAYTEGAIQLGVKTGLALLSTYALWKMVTRILDGKTTPQELEEIKKTIMTQVGAIHFD